MSLAVQPVPANYTYTVMLPVGAKFPRRQQQSVVEVIGGPTLVPAYPVGAKFPGAPQLSAQPALPAARAAAR